MNGPITAPALPQPALARWQPLRIGLVELFRYDSEEFWFRDGHLLLRGNNGTGKSKVLSLTLPLLLDANLRSARVEPDGDPGKRMAWNLLLGDAYERRTGYSWIEFGRVGAHGQAEFLTLGLGLHAVAARSHQVDSWYFTAQGQGARALRVGQGLWLLSAQRQVLGRERLREALGGGDKTGAQFAGQGQVYDNAQTYRRAVDERLFQLGARRYEALLDTLIQLRQPQLSRRPDEKALSAALTESLPPLAQELLGDVADALTQLEELRQSLERTQRLHQAVQSFDQRYRVYAGMASRRQARGLRQAQTEFDNASRARHAAQAELANALAAEAAAQQRRDAAATLLVGARSRHETLLANPLNSDAERLQRTSTDARQKGRDLEEAQRDADSAGHQAEREAESAQAAAQRQTRALEALTHSRQQALAGTEATGLHAALSTHPLLGAPAPSLLDEPAASLDAQRRGLLALPARRREDLALVRRRLKAWEDAMAAARPLQQTLQDRCADTEDASAALAGAEAQTEERAQAHQDAWAQHLHGLLELHIDTDAVLGALADWLTDGLTDGLTDEQTDRQNNASSEHPARRALLAAQSTALAQLADKRAALVRLGAEHDAETSLLQAESQTLRQGLDSGPPAPHWRGVGTRAVGSAGTANATASHAGAPLWQLVDFAPDLAAGQRAGLEAALQAAGLLDAWVTPAGQWLRGADGQPWRDASWLQRPARPPHSLQQWLHPALPTGCAVPTGAVAALLASLACGTEDAGDTEAWVGSDGRFRLAGLAGAAVVPEAARHIGHAARQAAREKRLAQIEQRLAALDAEQHSLGLQMAALAQRAQRITAEAQQTPSDQPWRQAQASVQAALRAMQQARQRENEAQTRWQQADQASRAARQTLERDAADLRLPVQAAALDELDAALYRCSEALHALAAAVAELRLALPEHSRQQQRLADAQAQLTLRLAQRSERAALAEAARAHLAALESVLGQQVDELKRRLDRAKSLVHRLQGSEQRLGEALRTATEWRAVAAQQQQQSLQRLEAATALRAAQAEALRLFAATGLLASGMASGVAAGPAEEELPDPASAWTLDTALNLARRVEQSLATLDDGEERWKRSQAQVTEELQELQRALSALGEYAAATTTDFGVVVHVQWQQRAQRPDALAALLHAEVLARQSLLSAREREVLENHLQAEIASQIQTLMRSASTQVAAINTELQRRPTSTGVRFRLQWQALPEGQDQGAPVGLHAARERLLHTASELWSAADRRAFGALLQQRIQDERQRADSGSGADAASLVDQLARALDYRQWHQFRVERWQDGSWRKLSGPSSSGERALGLTVPLFAAVATFYGASPLAPRLILLDEAFAGIDDAARAHCMALVREFDLDFVITSEREWACYSELPGVAICQLQRREGIDAVHVSRWTWDGRARRIDAAPARSGAPTENAGDSAGDTTGDSAGDSAGDGENQALDIETRGEAS